MSDLDLVVLVPALRRPANVAPFMASMIEHTPCRHRALFLCDPEDTEQQRACHAAGVDVHLFRPVHPQGAYPSKINAGVRITSEPYLFLAADDLRFHDGWWPAAMARIELGAQVVGVNDLIPRENRPEHATHFLMTRDYAGQPTVSGGRGPLCEDYHHWFVDDELILTAQRRGVYAYAADSVVEHLHPMVSKAPDDEVYVEGRAHARWDRRRFAQRRRAFLTGSAACR